MQLMRRVAALVVLVWLSSLISGCSAPASLLIFAVEQGRRADDDPTCLSAGCAAAAVLQHAYDKYTEGDPVPCRKLNSVARALTERCGAYQPGSLLARDVAASGLPRCPLALAARDPQFWPVLPELIEQGASIEACGQAPLVALAQAQPAPDLAAAAPDTVQALRRLALADPRAVHADVVRLLSSPGARRVGLDTVLDDWLASGRLPAAGLDFSPLAALHPSHVASPFSRALEALGHSAVGALGLSAGQMPSGFEAALAAADRVALDWWLDRVPALANRVPAARPGQLAWLPLARVITPGFLADAGQMPSLVSYLVARGADPWRPLPHAPGQSVVSLARSLKSVALAELDPPLLWPTPPGEQAAALEPALSGGGFAVPGLSSLPR